METKTGGEALQIWVLTDGRAGNRAQALGLAEAVARVCPAEVTALDRPPGRLAAWLPAGVSHRLSALPGWPDAGHAALPVPPPDLVIGAGRRVAPLVASLGQRGARTVQVLDPQMPHGAFDLVVVPEHDGVTGPNVLTSLGAPGRITPKAIAAEATLWAERIDPLPEPRAAVLIGGSGGMARWTKADAERITDAVTWLAAERTLLVTTSRRTNPVVTAALRSALPPERHLLHDGTGENPYPAILGHADAVLVTEDSVNMASEAASTGLPVHILRVLAPSAKAERLHASLAQRGIARDFAGQIERWSYPPLAEADRLAGEILARLRLA